MRIVNIVKIGSKYHRVPITLEYKFDETVLN
jgi:hypothetical protein